ncbi:hypothetical protein SAMN06298212_11634 [Ruaniaceae bacterium KH17]|nr:hypothetical protein SAMN06298212_11634 [Ruaniaceae bacterium KH17]
MLAARMCVQAPVCGWGGLSRESHDSVRGERELSVRVGNSTRSFGVAEAVICVSRHFRRAPRGSTHVRV